MASISHLPVMAQVRRWWSSPFDYEGRVRYFTDRSMGGSLKVVVGVNLLLYVALMMVLQRTGGPHSAAFHVVAAVICVVSTTWAIAWWVRPVPSRRWSIAFLVYCDLNIAVVALLVSDFAAGVLVLSFLILMSLYAVYWDGPKVLIAHSIWMIVVISAFCVQHLRTADVDPLLAAMMLLVCAGFVVSPPGIQFGVWVLLNEATESLTDPLTGVLNRRGLRLGAERLCQEPAAEDTHALVIVVDLDNFKAINDTWGHTIGDEVLTRSARRIEASVSDRALVARIGGEEFVVIDLAAADGAGGSAERVRQSINVSTDRVPVTASVGAISVPRRAFTEHQTDVTPELDALIDRADAAMLSVKRTGRNRAVLIALDGATET